jgi:quercetin dioxygenase-like cupin family protein
MRNTVIAVAALLAAIAAVAVGTAVATPGSGIGATILARGTLDGHFKLKLRDSSNAGDAIVQQLIVAPGGQTGWHSHPGPAIVVVKSGSFTLYDGDCAATTYSAGKVFVDSGYGHVHIGRNEGTTSAELWVTYLDVPVGESPRIDVDPAPANCF